MYNYLEVVITYFAKKVHTRRMKMKNKLYSLGLLIIISLNISACSSADNQYKQGNKLFAEGNYEEAEKYYIEAVTINPNRADYYINYGMTLIKLGKYEEAIAQFDRIYMEKSIQLVRENNKKALRGKGIAFYSMMNYSEAIACFDQALSMNELSELDMDILYYKGSAQKAFGLYAEAEETYTTIITIDQENREALSSRAYIYSRLGNYEKSIKDYDKILTLEPNSMENYMGKYNLLRSIGRTEDAYQVLEQVLKLEAKTPEDKYHLAKVHLYKGDYDLALAGLKEAYKKGFTEASYYIGDIYEIRKDYENAIHYYQQHLKECDPFVVTVYNQIGACYIKTGNYKEALKYLEKGLALQQADTMQALKKNEIVTYEKLGMFDIAYDKIREYRMEYPEDKEAIKEEEFLKTRQKVNE